MTLTVTEIMEQAKRLNQQEQKELIKLLIDALTVTDVSQSETHKKPRLSDLRGLGAEIWQDIDAQDYVNGMRDEWDQRP
jgi:replicative DNA helicase